MNENTQKLVDALRSGRFQQSVGSLRDGKNGRCCLGVACSISGLGRWVQRGGSGPYSYKIPGEYHEEAILPEPVREWLGWDTVNGVVPNPGNKHTSTNLAALNDGGYTFDRIADLIEQNYDYLTKGHS